MKLPRALSGGELAKTLRKRGYEITRQTGGHLRLTTQEHGQHHLTIPDHKALRIATLSGILSDVADHFGMTREEFSNQLFGS